MYVNFEIAALFPSPCSRVKKRGNVKTKIHLDSVESFLYHLSSSKLTLHSSGPLSVIIVYLSKVIFLALRLKH